MRAWMVVTAILFGIATSCVMEHDTAKLERETGVRVVDIGDGRRCVLDGVTYTVTCTE